MNEGCSSGGKFSVFGRNGLKFYDDSLGKNEDLVGGISAMGIIACQ